MLRRIFFLLTALCAIGMAHAQSFEQADRALRAAEHDLAVTHDGILPPDTPRGRLLLQREWRAQQVWAAAYLARHPAATQAALRHPELGNRDIPLTSQFARLGHGATLVATRDGEIGTVFVLAPRGGRLESIWSVTDAQAPSGMAKGRLLHDWSADCSVRYPPAEECHLLSGFIGVLPAKADGTARFYIKANYAQEMGATVATQFTIWDWDGTRATARYLKTYLVMIEQPVDLRQVGGTIVLRMKDEWRHFYSCGECNGRQRDLTLRLTPTAVEERSVRSVHPELDQIDRFIGRVMAGKPTSDLASPQAMAMLRAQARDNIEAGKDPKQADVAALLGMVMKYRITHRRRATTVCLDLDSEISNLFTLVGNRIVRITPVKSGSCDGPGSDL